MTYTHSGDIFATNQQADAVSVSEGGAPVPSLLHEHLLPEDHRAATVALASELRSDPIADGSGFARSAHLLTHRLPESLLACAYDFELEGGGLLLIPGIDVGPLGDTPSEQTSLVTHRTLLARVAAIVAAAFGHLVGYCCESGGRLCQTIVPVKADRTEQKSTGSVCLESHTEQCFNLISRPDFILLACLRGDPNAATFALSAREVQHQLPPKTVRLLRDTEFFTRIDPSFVAGGLPEQFRGPLAVLSGPEADPLICYDEDLMTASTAQHRMALAQLSELWRQARQSVVLTPGDLLVLDNSRVVHGRSNFRPRYDGSDRWLARFQVVKSLSGSRFARRGNSPVIEPSGC